MPVPIRKFDPTFDLPPEIWYPLRPAGAGDIDLRIACLGGAGDDLGSGWLDGDGGGDLESGWLERAEAAVLSVDF